MAGKLSAYLSRRVSHRHDRLDAVEREPIADARETTAAAAYCLRLKFRHTARVVEHRYETAMARSLAVIGYSTWADVLEMWEE